MITCTFEDGNQASLRHVTVGCVVIKEDKILLTKRSANVSLEAGKWCLPGGYVQRDETTAQAAHRETLEESGWEVGDMTLLRLNDNPNRPQEDRQNIDIIYVCSAGRRVGEKDWETEEVQWFKLSKLPPKDKIAFDHLDSIELYKRYLKQAFALPIIGPIFSSNNNRGNIPIVRHARVVGLVVSNDGRILLGKKNPQRDDSYPGTWQLPGGDIRADESQHEALRRNVKDELGIDITPYLPEFVDGSGHDESEQIDKTTGKKVVYQTIFYTYKVHLPIPSTSLPNALNGGEFMQLAWSAPAELNNYQLSPPTVVLFTKLGYLR
ncbi:MAG TPA: NUDIX hydrolase [Patescibacteria group bacterium]|nr:NUDIX hydrolase [Patescibacteria group bacterium]